MTKLSTLLVGLFVFINLCIGTLAGLTLVETPEASADTSRARVVPEDYAENNVYYLCSPTLTATIQSLKGVPCISDGSDPNLNKKELENGRPTYFTYPAFGRQTTLVYNQSFQGDPYISLIVNTYGVPGKVITVELGIDQNNDDVFEVVCTFPTYHTTNRVTQQSPTMEEELFAAYGTWQGGTPPAVYEGWLKLKVTMTSPNGDPCLLYCGFDFKQSWAAIPYMHTDLLPHAEINKTFQRQGFIEEGKTKVQVGDMVWFDARDSYDPNDDLNGNRKIDPGEIDHLQYRWNFGDGTSEKYDHRNRNMSHVFTSDSISKDKLFKIFEVNLTVRNPKLYSSWNRTYIKVFRGNHSPEIKAISINGIPQYPVVMGNVKSPLDSRVEVTFSAIATDADGDDITYHWDFDGDLSKFEKEGPEWNSSTVKYSFEAPKYQLGTQGIKLVVSDGTPVENGTAGASITFVENKKPIAKIRARRETDHVDTWFYQNMTVIPDQNIIFDASLSFDPDNLTGFETGDKEKPHIPLKYRWNYNVFDLQSSSSWTRFPEQIYSYSSAGVDLKYIVTLEVDDGLSITTSDNFTVSVNVRPEAKISIEPNSYNPQGNFEMNRPIHLNSTGSFDPNGDKIKSYEWDFGDGNKSYEERPVHTYTTPSEYTVSLIVYEKTEYSLSSIPDQLIIDIPYPPEPPIVREKIYPLQTYTHKEIRFDASATTDPDSDYKDLKFKWDFGDNSTSTEANTTHRYLKEGDYLITIEVTDDTGTKSTKSEFTVHILNRKPIAKIRQLKNIEAGDNVRLSGADSRDDDGYISQLLWDFGDGSESDWVNETFIEHKWSHRGTYTITLTVMDDAGLTNETQMQIRVKEAAETAGWSSDTVNTMIAGSIITVIIIIVIVIVIIVFKRSQEGI